ncbi:MAG: tyrosine-type recombinase/integrase, partial [Nostoc sp.]
MPIPSIETRKLSNFPLTYRLAIAYFFFFFLVHLLSNLSMRKSWFGICLFSACRIRECCTLLTQDIYTVKGNVRPRLIIRKSNTKGKLATRSIPVIEDLRRLLVEYYLLAGDDYLFPGRSNGHISEDSAARILREACKQAGIIGVSTHSFRRTALTQMSNAGIPLRVIQEISGHRNLEQLQRYLEVSDEPTIYMAFLALLSVVLALGVTFLQPIAVAGISVIAGSRTRFLIEIAALAIAGFSGYI